ncbi:gamma-glutamylcyclotransferase family protein [Eubacteriaceae bacterium ES2]|nr:gamma-glutamylcyclotransferase family protein [Eubacteriaceae bacterium ES2]
MELLFSYGTLREEFIQKKIFGRSIPSKAAKLEQHQLKMDADGFFYLVPGNQCVYGRILQLSNIDLLRADQWEEVPVYERERIEVEVDGQMVEVWTYLKKRVHQQKTVKMKNLSSALKEESLHTLLENFCRVRDLSFPAADIILRFPGRKLPPNKLIQLKKRLFGEKVEPKSMDSTFYWLGEMQIEYKNYPLRLDIYWMDHDAFSGEVLVAMGMILVHPERIHEKIQNSLPDFLKDRDIELQKGFRGHLFTEDPLEKRRHYRIVVFPEWFEETYSDRFLKEMELIKIESEIESGA